MILFGQTETAVSVKRRLGVVGVGVKGRAKGNVQADKGNGSCVRREGQGYDVRQDRPSDRCGGGAVANGLCSSAGGELRGWRS